MSDHKPSFEEALIAVDKENQEYNSKLLELKKFKVNRQYEDMLERQKQAEKATSIDVTRNDPSRIIDIAEKTKEYLIQARKSKVFLTNHFIGKVPYFARNIILVGAMTGDGKSTTSANLAYRALRQGQKVLVITNEENTGDVYNRVTCLFRGMGYQDHTKFTDEQIDILTSNMKVLANRMTVIDDNYNGDMGQTTTIEGIESILTALIKSQEEHSYDVVVFDYYQNVDKSIKDPSMPSWQVQERFCKLLDSFKNVYNAPIIVLAQKKQTTENTSFKESIEGRKAILNVATCALEVIANRELLRTEWTIRKSRFAASVGETVYTGYNKGEYVLYDTEFKMEVEHRNQQRKVSRLITNQINRDGKK